MRAPHLLHTESLSHLTLSWHDAKMPESRSADPQRMACFVVVPDRGGQCEDPGQDPGEDAPVGAAAVSFEVKLAFEGLVDGFDDLPQRLEELTAGPFRLALAGR